MKKFIIKKCINYIEKNTNYDDIKLKEIEYGLISIYLTFSKMFIIIMVAYILGIVTEVFIFMLFFSILRTTGFGLHASKSWICLLSSTLLFIGIPILCKYIVFNIYIKTFICLIGVLLTYKNAPADTKNKPIINKKRRLILKLLTTVMSIMFSIVLIIIKNQFISNCLIFAIILENIMMSPTIYKIFKLPYNNYISFLKEHPDFIN